ncbi:hypothetical protein [Pectobacterium brasiliense]|uniref:hypothetical protein n=1 Tax=Pectobacterium brasiliense TaxID=180957 RepID=UPI001CF4F24F|nr:hypothetical protein [Pectobacterium brasiliense]MCA6985049.1 hypothetical protein [Pectobacterium brasiliense]
MDGKEARHHLTIQRNENNIGKAMDVLFEFFLPKNINFNKFGWEEVYTEWGGQQYPQEPAVYKWNDLLLFEANKDVLSYERLLGRDVSLRNYCAYTLKSSSLFDLEQCVNKRVDVSDNAVFLFFDNFLKDVDHWVVLTLIDWDQFDEIHNVNNEKEAFFFLMESLDWNEPKGIALIKN